MLETAEEPPPLLHPNLAKLYHEEMAARHVGSIDEEGTRARRGDAPHACQSYRASA